MTHRHHCTRWFRIAGIRQLQPIAYRIVRAKTKRDARRLAAKLHGGRSGEWSAERIDG